MSHYPLQLPEELMEEIRRLAAENQVSLDQWLLMAIAEKVGSERVGQLLRRYAARADYDRFDVILARVPEAEPVAGDEL
ncbi:hypothetical protein [Phormidesmis priestleyi]